MYSKAMFAKQFKISIHALREEGDFLCRSVIYLGIRISIHALREEGDTRSKCSCRP